MTFRPLPVLLERLAGGGRLNGAPVSIDAIATNAKIAKAIKDAGADYLLAVKANQPALRAETQGAFETTGPEAVYSFILRDKGHGRIDRPLVSVITEADWLAGDRRLVGVIKVCSRAELSDRSAFRDALHISSAFLSAERGDAVSGQWNIENWLHWVSAVI